MSEFLKAHFPTIEKTLLKLLLILKMMLRDLQTLEFKLGKLTFP